MVDQMTRHWLGLFPNEPIEHMVASEVFDDVREKMSSLLKLLEHKGMLPPFMDVPYPNMNKNYFDLHHNNGEYASYTCYAGVCEWEKEK